MTNKEYKNTALAALKGNWAPAVVAAIVYLAIVLVIVMPYSLNSGINPGSTSPVATVVYMLGSIFVLLPLGVGIYNAYLRLVNDGDANITSNMFSVGFGNYGHKLGGMFLVQVFTILWSLLFLIPGLIKTFSYAMTPFILEERPELSANQAIEESMRMMKGHKFDLFYLYLSFIGWIILSLFTAGIGLFWVIPYMYSATAAFYNDIKSVEVV